MCGEFPSRKYLDLFNNNDLSDLQDLTECINRVVYATVSVYLNLVETSACILTEIIFLPSAERNNAREKGNAQHQGLQRFELGSAHEFQSHVELWRTALGHWMSNSPSRRSSNCCCDTVPFLFH